MLKCAVSPPSATGRNADVNQELSQWRLWPNSRHELRVRLRYGSAGTVAPFLARNAIAVLRSLPVAPQRRPMPHKRSIMQRP